MKLWIARDEDGDLYLYEREPIREFDYFYSPYVYPQKINHTTLSYIKKLTK